MSDPFDPDITNAHYAAEVRARKKLGVWVELNDMSDVPAGFKRPFKYDGWEFIFDANGRMAADLYEGSFRPRGWGRVQYLPNPHLTMNEWEFWLKRKVGDCTDPEEVVNRMNEVSR